MTQAVRKAARTSQPTEAPEKTKPGKPSRKLVDEIDAMLDEIDTVLEEVAGGETSEYAEEFVKNYVQKGGQ
jgi:ubiquitin-like protein Pup